MTHPDNAYFVLWAIPSGEEVPFEVSREVADIIHPDCPTSPHCPEEKVSRVVGVVDPESGGRRVSQLVEEYNPDFSFEDTDCPYGYISKDECYREINRIALKKGCIPGRDIHRVANFLKALGYRVFSEPVTEDDLEGQRILLAHGMIYNFHDLRCERGPAGLILYLIRNPRESEMPPGLEEL